MKNDEPKVKVESEASVASHWFKKVFYRKDGTKLTLIPKRAQFLFGVFLLFGYLTYLFQGSPQTRSVTKSGFNPSQSALSEQKTEIPEAKAGTQKEGNAKSKGARKSRPTKLYTGPELVTRPKIPIPPGTVAKGKLVTGASNGPVRAKLTEPVLVNGEVLLEAGPILIGTGSSTEERLFIRFDQMVFKDGTVQSIEAQVFDPEDKLAGLKGSLLGNRTVRLAGSIGLNFVGGLSDGLQDTQTQGGTAFRPSTLKNAFLNGASVAAIDESRNEMSKLKNEMPVIQVDAGREIIISF